MDNGAKLYMATTKERGTVHTVQHGVLTHEWRAKGSKVVWLDYGISRTLPQW